MEDGLTAYPQVARVSMPPVFELSPLLEQESGQEANHELDSILEGFRTIKREEDT